MAKTRLSPKATYVERGYGQVEPNHLSAQRTGQIYAQLPAASTIDLLENGQFVKYDYANNQVNFTGAGEWMLVFNEIKLYRDGMSDCDFAMIADNYRARVYSPIDGNKMEQHTRARIYGGGYEAITPGASDVPSALGYYEESNGTYTLSSDATVNSSKTYYIAIPKVVTAADPWEMDSTDNPFAEMYDYGGPKLMKDLGSVNSIVPRVLKTNVGDIYTTNTIKAATLAVNDKLIPDTDGYLKVTTASTASDPMVWQVVKVYDMPDRQQGVKIMRIQ